MYLIGTLAIWPLISIAASTITNDKLGVLLCIHQCKCYSGCTSVRFSDNRLLCELIFGTNNTFDTGMMAVFKVEEENSKFGCGCGRKERIVYNRRGSVKCVKAAPRNLAERITAKEEPYRNTTPVTSTDGRRHCILKRRENQRVKSDLWFFSYMQLRAGMRMIVCGGSSTEILSSSIFLRKNKYGPPKIWYRIQIIWRKSELMFIYSTSSMTYSGNFPISDRSHFTLAFEFTQWKIKVYADKVQVFTAGYSPGWYVVSTRGYTRIHLIELQKIDEACKNTIKRIP